MAQEVARIKKRIKAIKGSYKITSAMKLVSTVKLKRWKSLMTSSKQYCEQIDELASLVFNYIENEESNFFIDVKNHKKLYIIVSSSLGLCGSYNNNIFHLIDEKIDQDDELLVFGKKGNNHFQNFPNLKIDLFNEQKDLLDKRFIKELADFIYLSFENKKYQEIHLVYTSFVNTLTFHPVDYMILPLKKRDNLEPYPPIMEPHPKALLKSLMPLYLRATLSAKLMESEVCEQASRSNAMENASNNAEQLLNDLQIQFNKARQGAITQEISEIVGASNI